MDVIKSSFIDHRIFPVLARRQHLFPVAADPTYLTKRLREIERAFAHLAERAAKGRCTRGAGGPEPR